MFDLNLSSLDCKPLETDSSLESLLIDEFCSDEQEFNQLAQSFESCTLMLDLVREHGSDNEVVKQLIGDQIEYSSKEELEQKLEEACEGLFNKIKDSISVGLAKAKNKISGIDAAVAKINQLKTELDEQKRRTQRDVDMIDGNVKVPNLSKIEQSIKILDKVAAATEKAGVSGHFRAMQTVIAYLNSRSTYISAMDQAASPANAIKNANNIKATYTKLETKIHEFMGVVQRQKEGYVRKDADGNVTLSKSDLMKYVILGNKTLAAIRGAIIRYASLMYKAIKKARRDDAYHHDQKYFDKTDAGKAGKAKNEI